MTGSGAVLLLLALAVALAAGAALGAAWVLDHRPSLHVEVDELDRTAR
ncbi:MAG: hypothetical protein JWR88_1032 [Pseudonocardia sp.]|nr:hypothetical protein [Pseudonocardia sp.]